MSKVEEVLDSIGSMTVLELSELLEAFEEKFGVTAAAPVAMAAPVAAVAAGDAGADDGAAEDKTSFDVEIASVGDKKIQVIKELRALTSLGLKEAKELVEAAPKVVMEGVSKEDADKAKASLEEAGAAIEIK